MKRGQGAERFVPHAEPPEVGAAPSPADAGPGAGTEPAQPPDIADGQGEYELLPPPDWAAAPGRETRASDAERSADKEEPTQKTPPDSDAPAPTGTAVADDASENPSDAPASGVGGEPEAKPGPGVAI